MLLWIQNPEKREETVFVTLYIIVNLLSVTYHSPSGDAERKGVII